MIAEDRRDDLTPLGQLPGPGFDDSLVRFSPEDRAGLLVDSEQDLTFFRDFVALDAHNPRYDQEHKLGDWHDIEIRRYDNPERTLEHTEHYYLSVTDEMIRIARSRSNQETAEQAIAHGDMVSVRRNGEVLLRRHGETQLRSCTFDPGQDLAIFLSRDIVSPILRKLSMSSPAFDSVLRANAYINAIPNHYTPPISRMVTGK